MMPSQPRRQSRRSATSGRRQLTGFLQANGLQNQGRFTSYA